MKTEIQKSLISTLVLGISVFAIALILHGCGIKAALSKIDERMSEAIHSMDKAIATLAQQSSDWQTVITDLSESITAEMQSTIDNEVQNLTRNSVLTTGGEVRCNAEFMRVKLRRTLIDMRNSLAQSINSQLINVGLSGYQFGMIQQDIPEPFICDIVPSAVDLSLDPDRRKKLDIYGFDLRSMPIYVTYRSLGLFQAKPSVGYKDYVREMTPRADRVATNITAVLPAVIREDIRMSSFNLAQPYKIFQPVITSSLSVLSDFHAVLDLTAAGANLPPNASEIVLSWNNQLKSEIPILTDIQTLECETTGQPLAAGLAQTFIPPAVEGHDKEFDGHGPCMSVYIYLWLDAERKNLYATYTVDAFECNDDFGSPRKDYTEAYGTQTKGLFSVTQEGEIIESFDAASTFYDTYIDSDHNWYAKYYTGTAPVEKIEWNGDTDGDEAGTRTGVILTFRQFNVNVKKCVYK
jgi:hypothetical protein